MKIPVPPQPSTGRSLHALLLMVTSVGVYALQDVLVKKVPPSISLVEILFFRSIFSLVVILPMIFWEPHPHPFRTKHPFQHLLRALSTFLATLCFISAFRRMPLAEAYTITFSAPLFMTLFATLFLKERGTFQRWLAVIVGFMGVVLIVRPGQVEATLGSLIALGGGLFHAIGQLFTRKLSQKDSLSLIVTSFTLLMLGLTGCLMPFYWQPYTLDVLLPLAMVGLLGGGAHYLMSRAFQLAPVTFLAPFDYVALLWGLFFDALLWHVFPKLFMLVGGSLIIVAGAFLLRSEQKTHV